ncbi:hypothetical protein PSCLAVI8L_100165 [Pseudoclavibacter sp. 8L]|nr:hypothetical protein PSCLAVI8L_100165 [Pseudoclavibacter sp. 8L]
MGSRSEPQTTAMRRRTPQGTRATCGSADTMLDCLTGVIPCRAPTRWFQAAARSAVGLGGASNATSTAVFGPVKGTQWTAGATVYTGSAAKISDSTTKFVPMTQGSPRTLTSVIASSGERLSATMTF